MITTDENKAPVSAPLPEVWLRGPVEEVPDLLQPVAHALLQAANEIEEIFTGFPPGLLWSRIAGTASPGFHLRHITGVLDRLFTYASGSMLSTEQLEFLAEETGIGRVNELPELLATLQERIRMSVEKLKSIDTKELLLVRYVGRNKIPSTMLGLLFHSAEHALRHTGQLIVTVAVLKKEGI